MAELKYNQPAIVIPDDTFGYGKHRGRTIDYILQHDPTYIRWCLEQEQFVLSGPLEMEYMKKSRLGPIPDTNIRRMLLNTPKKKSDTLTIDDL